MSCFRLSFDCRWTSVGARALSMDTREPRQWPRLLLLLLLLWRRAALQFLEQIALRSTWIWPSFQEEWKRAVAVGGRRGRPRGRVLAVRGDCSPVSDVLQ